MVFKYLLNKKEQLMLYLADIEDMRIAKKRIDRKDRKLLSMEEILQQIESRK